MCCLLYMAAISELHIDNTCPFRPKWTCDSGARILRPFFMFSSWMATNNKIALSQMCTRTRPAEMQRESDLLELEIMEKI
jgi:hypothetical protein